MRFNQPGQSPVLPNGIKNPGLGKTTCDRAADPPGGVPQGGPGYPSALDKLQGWNWGRVRSTVQIHQV